MGSEVSRGWDFKSFIPIHICLSLLPAERPLITAGTRTSKRELDPALNFLLKAAEEVVYDPGNWALVFCSPKYYWRCWLVFPPSCTWFQETADIFCTQKKDFISLAFFGKRLRWYIWFQKEVRKTIIWEITKKNNCDFVGLFPLTIGWAPGKEGALGSERQLLPLHCHYKSMTNWKCINKYTDKLTLKKHLRTVG